MDSHPSSVISLVSVCVFFLTYLLALKGIKRWTDGLLWSPSRILGNFLVYREIDKRSPIVDKRQQSVDSSAPTSTAERLKERALVGSLTNSYKFKRNGLIKKTMSIVVNGSTQHMISYYNKEDVASGRLHSPRSIPMLANLEVSPEFLQRQNFRIPLHVESSGVITDRTSTSPTLSTGESNDLMHHDNETMSHLTPYVCQFTMMPIEEKVKLPLRVIFYPPTHHL
jgi:Gti1/Pac2 family